MTYVKYTTHGSNASPLYHSLHQGISGALQTCGSSHAGASFAAAARLYDVMMQQASVLAYIDTVHVLVILTACLIPIGYLMKKPRFRSKQAAPIE